MIQPKSENMMYVGMLDMSAPIPLERLVPCDGSSLDGIRVIRTHFGILRSRWNSSNLRRLLLHSGHRSQQTTMIGLGCFMTGRKRTTPKNIISES